MVVLGRKHLDPILKYPDLAKRHGNAAGCNLPRSSYLGTLREVINYHNEKLFLISGLGSSPKT